jgi:hypothetical protein
MLRLAIGFHEKMLKKKGKIAWLQTLEIIAFHTLVLIAPEWYGDLQ